MRKSRRIEFEPELYASLRGRSRHFKKRPVVSVRFIAILFGIIVAVLLFSGFIPVPPLFGTDLEIDALTRLNSAFWVALQSNNLPSATQCFAAETQDEPQDATATSKEESASRLGMLQTMREDLSLAGLNWPSAELVAFVGVRAHAFESEAKQQNASVAIGELLIRSGTLLFSIELSTRNGEDGCHLAELWHWGKSAYQEDGLSELTELKMQEFKSENPEGTQGKIRLTDVRPVLIYFK